MSVIGIDIGTTNICGILVNVADGEVIKYITVPNDTFLKNVAEDEMVQDPERIMEIVEDILISLMNEGRKIQAIGVTGQMHGILYLDKRGEPLSPLYTWQDERGDRPYKEGFSYAQYLSKITGYTMASGFGITTHYYLTKTNGIPSGAVFLSTIHDYVAMKLARAARPITSPSNGASMGCFHTDVRIFDTDTIRGAGMDVSMLPPVRPTFTILGRTYDNIPVCNAIGDNQASVTGSVQDLKKSALIHIGTGSQLSMWTDTLSSIKGVEVRPCGNEYIYTGAVMCGGKAYAILESFFSMVCAMAGMEIDDQKLYEQMEEWVLSHPIEGAPLDVSTRYLGTREFPVERGSIVGLSEHNFTPQHIIMGTLEGIAGELFDLYQIIQKETGRRAAVLVGSGNGLRRSKLLQSIIEKVFGMELKIPKHREEAAYGAALCALTGTGYFENITEAQKIIRYQK